MPRKYPLGDQTYLVNKISPTQYEVTLNGNRVTYITKQRSNYISHLEPTLDDYYGRIHECHSIKAIIWYTDNDLREAESEES